MYGSPERRTCSACAVARDVVGVLDQVGVGLAVALAVRVDQRGDLDVDVW